MIEKTSKNFLKISLLSFVFIFTSMAVFAKGNFDYVYTIKNTNFDFKPQKDHFLDSLAREYKSYSIYKSEMTDDFNGANYFAKKSLKAYTGEFVKPYNVYELNMKLSTATHIYRLYDDLMFFFTNNLDKKYPLLMADAQSKFDCFIDSEVVNNNPKQAVTCYQKLTKTMGILNKKLDEVCDAKCKLLRQGSNIGKKWAKQDVKKLNFQVTRKKSKLKKTKNNSQLNRYVQVYPLNDMDKLKEERLLIKNEAFVRPIGKKIVNNDFVIPVKDNKTPAEKINSNFTNTMSGMDLEDKNAVAVKPVVNKDESEKKDINLSDIQQKLQEIDAKIEMLSKKNCNCDLDKIKAEFVNLTKKTNEIKGIEHKDNIIDLDKEAKILETKIENIATENPDVVSIESEVTETIQVVDDAEDNEDNIIEPEIETEPEFQQITEKEVVETEIFDWDKDNVKSKYKSELQDITEKALKSKETIVIQGHTDNTGSEKYNDDLSKRRATNVGKIVMSYGVPKEKIILQGIGSRNPKVPTKQGERNEKNRRVVIK